MNLLYLKKLNGLFPELLTPQAIALLSISFTFLLFAPAVDAIQIDFSDNPSDPIIGDLTNINSNNYGAMMTYQDAITDAGTALDLVVEVVDSYSPYDVTKNGSISGDIGQINIAANSSTKFKFSIVEAGTNIPYTVGNIDFSLLDVDGNNGNNGAVEKVILYSPADYSLVDETPYLTLDDSLGDRIEITATNNKVTNPNSSTTPDVSSTVDPSNALTTEQEQHSISFEFNNVSEFDLGYEVIGGNKGRNFYFTGEVFFDEVTDVVTFEPVPFEFSPTLGLLISGGFLLGCKYFTKNQDNNSCSK